MILDLDGYRIRSGFILREMGVYSQRYGSLSWMFENTLPFFYLDRKDQHTCHYVYRHVHGLPFESTPTEKAYPQHLVKHLVDVTYHQSKTHGKQLAAYKGGRLEKDLLQELQIPCINLEDLGCPKVEELVAVGFKPGSSCGHHLKPTLHCPKQETYLFYQWMQSQLNKQTFSHSFS